MCSMATRNQIWPLIVATYFVACCVLRADVIIDLTYIGNPGNPADVDTGSGAHGAVSYGYYIGTYEVTVAQYTEFLNSVAQSDPYGLYHFGMGPANPLGAFIIQNGTDGSYSYTAVTGIENQPVRWVSCFDAMRFANWMHNGQGNGDTETGSYNLAVGDPTFVTREPGATWVLPTLDEWYKAAYYSPMGVYYDYPNGSDDVPPEPVDETSPREMNFGDLPFWQGSVVFTSVGETTGQSPYGTFDQGGNVREWTETMFEDQPQVRLQWGGTAFSSASGLNTSSGVGGGPPSADDGAGGFRLVFLIPEPSTVMLMLAGLPLVFASSAKRWRGQRMRR